MMKLYYTWILLFISHSFFAQDQWINYTNGYYITDIEESDGGLWLSSTGGLCYVDSLSQNETYYNRGNSNLFSNSINDILLHPNNDLWMTTSKGIGLLRGGQFYEGPEGITGIMDITPDEKIIVVDADSLYIQLNNMDFKAVAYPRYIAGFGGIEINSEGTIYVNCINFFAETYVAVYKNDEWEVIYSDFIYESAIAMDKDEKLWMINGSGLMQWENDSFVLVTALDSLNNFSVRGLFVDSENNIIIGIDGDCPVLLKWNGTEIQEMNFTKDECDDCFFIKPSSKKVDTYFATNRKNGFYDFSFATTNGYHSYSQSPLLLNSVLTTLHPSDNSHIIVLPNNIQKIVGHDWSNTDLPLALSSQIRYAYNSEDKLWICDNESIWFNENGEWNNLMLPGNPTTNIDFMVVGENGDVWIKSGTYISLYKDNEWETFSASHHNLTNGIIQDMQIDPSNGDLWVSTFQGVRQYNGSTWTTYEFPPSNQCFGLAISPDGVYVRKAGLFLIKNGIIDTISMPPVGYYGPFESEMIYDYQKQKLYISGSDHLAVLKDDIWTVQTIENSGLQNGYSHDLNIDKQGNLWLSGAGGGLEIYNPDGVIMTNVNYIDKEGLSIKVFPTIVPSNQIVLRAVKGGKYDVIICDRMGNRIVDDKLFLPINQNLVYDIPSIPTGLYFITLRQGNKVVTKKFIRQ